MTNPNITQEPSRICVGCGNSITFVRAGGGGVWIDELRRGHCTALPGGHRPSTVTDPATPTITRESRAQAVYVPEWQTSPDIWHVLNRDMVYPTAADAKRAADKHHGFPLSWSDEDGGRIVSYGLGYDDRASYRVRSLTVADSTGRAGGA